MQGSKHYWQYRLYIVAHQTAKILIIPQIQRPFRNLNLVTIRPYVGLPENEDLQPIWRVVEIMEFGF
jgi:hypothetical protein